MPESKWLLPVVTEDTVKVVKANSQNKTYLQGVLKRIKRQNPVIGSIITYLRAPYAGDYHPPTKITTPGPLNAVLLVYAMLEKSGQLPRNSEDTLFATIHSTITDFQIGVTNCDSLESCLQKDNPCLYTFIKQYAFQAGEPNTVDYITTLVYRLLENQVRANKLKYEFKIR